MRVGPNADNTRVTQREPLMRTWCVCAAVLAACVWRTSGAIVGVLFGFVCLAILADMKRRIRREI